jgi:hypothetical protein
MKKQPHFFLNQILAFAAILFKLQRFEDVLYATVIFKPFLQA